MKHHITSYRSVPRETFCKLDYLVEKSAHDLESYIDQLLWWNKRVNLVSRDVPRETIMEHVRHSILLTQLNIYESSNYIIDSGTGGGLPGLPLAIVSQNKKFLLNDIVTKKTMVLKQMVRKLGLDNVVIQDGSVSGLRINKKFLLISKHAFKISELLALAEDLPWSAMVFYKGTDFEDEIKDVQTPLYLNVYDLGQANKGSFYKGKSIITVEKQ